VNVRRSRGFWGGGECGANAWLLGYIYMKNGIVIAVACRANWLSSQQYSFNEGSPGPNLALLNPEPNLSLKWHIFITLNEDYSRIELIKIDSHSPHFHPNTSNRRTS
jgi:hypothetical protein